MASVIVLFLVEAAVAGEPNANVRLPDLPDRLIVEAYQQAAVQNVLAAVNPKVFPGYWAVCADGEGYDPGNSFPTLDGRQMADALLYLGQVETVKQNFAFVKSFQKPNGLLPLAILPSQAGQMIGPPDAQSRVEANGGLYLHWVPGNPLGATGSTTYIQNADLIYRHTGDPDWLAQNLASVNLAADYLASLTTPGGQVAGAGYYVEFPTRLDYDGVTQGYAADAFQRVAALNAVAGHQEASQRYQGLANQIISNFQSNFWVGDHFAEYLSTTHGRVANHGLTDSDWCAIATGMATPAQVKTLWPQLQEATNAFYYDGMPTGIATLPQTYEDWEFSYPNARTELAAMGRVWTLEAWARARMGDGPGLLKSLAKVAQVGRDNGYFWRERYNAKGGYGVAKYNEYPANLIAIVQRFLLGVDFGLDGTLELAPTAPEEFWRAGFGQTLSWRGRTLSYRMQTDQITGDYCGEGSQRLCLRFPQPAQKLTARVTLQGHSAEPTVEGDQLVLELPAAPLEQPCHFEVHTGAISARAELALGTMKADKILFLGNSITNHGPAPFWEGGAWGMAASSLDKDYVHILTNALAQRVGGTPTILPISFGTRGNFEVNYPSYDYQLLKAELAFQADVVVVAIGENVPDFNSQQEKDAFLAAFTKLLTVLKNNTHPSPTIFVKSTFIVNPIKDDLMRQATTAVGGVWVDQSRLGNDPLNRAYSEPLYAKNKVVNTHPGDRGMKAIADSLLEAMVAHGAGKR